MIKAKMKAETAMGCNLRATGSIDSLDGKWIEIESGEEINIIAISPNGKIYLIGKRIGTNDFFGWIPVNFVEKIDE